MPLKLISLIYNTKRQKQQILILFQKRQDSSLLCWMLDTFCIFTCTTTLKVYQIVFKKSINKKSNFIINSNMGSPYILTKSNVRLYQPTVTNGKGVIPLHFIQIG